MTTETRPLFAGQRIVVGEYPTAELVEIIERQNTAIAELQAVVSALADVSAPSGGGTVDTEARTAIAAIIAAAS